MTTPTLDPKAAERADFEKVWLRAAPRSWKVRFGRDSSGDYIDNETNCAWLGYQLATPATPPRAPEPLTDVQIPTRTLTRLHEALLLAGVDSVRLGQVEAEFIASHACDAAPRASQPEGWHPIMETPPLRWHEGVWFSDCVLTVNGFGHCRVERIQISGVPSVKPIPSYDDWRGGVLVTHAGDRRTHWAPLPTPPRANPQTGEQA